MQDKASTISVGKHAILLCIAKFRYKTIMKYFSAIFLFLLLCASSVQLNALRTWTDIEGRSIEARLVRIVDDNTIRIERSDGWVGNIDISLLSGKDREYLRIEQTIAQLEQADPLQSDIFQIRSLRRGTVPGYVSTDSGWEHGIASIIAVVRYTGDRPRTNGYVRAYFFDRENRQVGSFTEPPRRQDNNRTYINAPRSFDAGQDYELHFPLSKALQDRSWRTVIVVFGNQTTSSLRSIPSQINPIDFDFDEKENFFPGLSAALAARETNDPEITETSPTFTLQLQPPRRLRHPHSIRSGGEWKQNLECIFTEVRAVGGIPSENLSIAIRFFDQNRRLVATRRAPSMTNLYDQVYSRIPDIARANNWYPVFFALDEDLESIEWTHAVVTARAGSQVSSIVFGPGNLTPDNFGH